MKSLYGLLRCGEMAQAQEYCVAHKHHWMAASLLGSGDSYYNTSYSDVNNENDNENDNDGGSRDGNERLRTSINEEGNENTNDNNGKTK